MRGRRSSRSAAVVLAGCVGLAVIAPGLALAAEIPGVATAEECATENGVWDATNEVCDDGATAIENEDTTPVENDTTPPVDNDTTPPVENDTTPPVDNDTTPPVDNDTTPPVDNDTTPPVENDTTPPVENDTTPPVENDTTPPVENDTTPPVENDTTPPSEEEVEIALPDLQEEVDKVLPDAGANPIGLPNLPTIPQPVDGKFENVNDACLNAISKLEFPAGTTGLEHLSSQLQGFCRGLDTTDVDVCLEHLRDVLKHLCPTVIEYNTTINIVNWNISHEWWGAYWTHRYDVDCDEVTFDEANAILDWDRSDPFRLDRDDDGIACERNVHEHEVDYASYPEGGVSTGDGSTGSGASAAEVALAAGALGGLGATGLVLVRRYARQG
ncbi:hypothetical protein ACFPK1_04155 [Actinomycetospora rhizophila]|uniref:Excalibur calcium-binding domain-containing protein n=1 Tax=Actinomycetospora rhizophila TaxID=1416876 RepID=A0ABV9Z765_9PSEU